MSCFQLTKKVCKTLASYMAKYWWSSNLDRRSLHWLSWKGLASPKVKGGMGFKDLQLFNIALLGKHGWRLMMNPNSLCSRVLKARYFPSSDFMSATAPKSSSAIWRAIIAGKEALSTGLLKRVGSGTSVSIWEDKWIPCTRSLTPIAHIGNAHLHRVSDLIDAETWIWKSQVIRENFIPPDVDVILNIPLRIGGGDDILGLGL